METPRDLPPSLAELEAKMPSRSKELQDIARCIGCIVRRSAQEDNEIPITTPAIATCTGRSTGSRDYQRLFSEMRRLEEHGLIEEYTPSKPPSLNRGNWQPRRTYSFRVTDAGHEIFLPAEDDACNLLDPLIRLTPNERRFVDCARCLLAKNTDTEENLSGGFMRSQLISCQQAIPQTVGRILRGLVQDAILKREKVRLYSTGKEHEVFSPTKEATTWLSPLKVPDCPDPDRPELPARKLSAAQAKLLGCLACIFNDCGSEVIFRADVIKCLAKETHFVDNFFKKMVREEYLEKRSDSAYTITEAGETLLHDTPSPESCSLGRREAMLDLQDHAIKRVSTFKNTLRCLGCMAARQVPLNQPFAAACNSISSGFEELRAVRMTFNWLEAAGMLEKYTPSQLPEVPAWGNWMLHQANYYRLTQLGRLAIPIRASQSCKLENPISHLTPDEKKIVDCFTCTLARTAQPGIPTAGGVTAEQIGECQNMRQAKPAKLLKAFYDAGLLDRKTIPRSVSGKGRGPNLYWPTETGEPWLVPQRAEACMLPNVEASPLEEFSVSQRLLLGCLACMHSKGIELRKATTRRCTFLSIGATSLTFQKLEAKGYIEAYTKPNRQKVDHYKVTPHGKALFDAVKPLRHCSLDGIENTIDREAFYPEQTVPSSELSISPTIKIIATAEQQTGLVENRALLEAFCIKLASQRGTDIAQVAAMRFLTKVPPAVEQPEQIRAWLFTTARRLYADSVRQAKRMIPTAPEDLPDLTDAQEVEASLDFRETATENAAVLAVLQRLLSPDQWQLVEELYIKNRRPAELAAELGLTANALSARRTRVWNTIKQIVEQQSGRSKGYYTKKEKLPVTDLLRELLTAKD